jgi:hypothetical protein
MVHVYCSMLGRWLPIFRAANRLRKKPRWVSYFRQTIPPAPPRTLRPVNAYCLCPYVPLLQAASTRLVPVEQRGEVLGWLQAVSGSALETTDSCCRCVCASPVRSFPSTARSTVFQDVCIMAAVCCVCNRKRLRVRWTPWPRWSRPLSPRRYSCTVGRWPLCTCRCTRQHVPPMHVAIPTLTS